MKKKEIRKALEGGTPFSSLYSLLPSGQKEKFKQFAAAFGFTERQVRERLRKETRQLLIDNGRPRILLYAAGRPFRFHPFFYFLIRTEYWGHSIHVQVFRAWTIQSVAIRTSPIIKSMINASLITADVLSFQSFTFQLKRYAPVSPPTIKYKPIIISSLFYLIFLQIRQ